MNKIGIFICFFFVTCLSFFCFNCQLQKRKNIPPVYLNYRDIPGVTEEEIKAIELLKSEKISFVYGMNYSIETFYKEDGTIGGYAALFCDLLSNLFDISFKPYICEWDELIAGMDSCRIDFTGELTATPERLKKYYMTDAITGRSLKYFIVKDGEDIFSLIKQRRLKFAFLDGTITSNLVETAFEGQFDKIFIETYEEAVKLLIEGKVDVFFEDSPAEAAFDSYEFIIAKDFFPLVFSPVSLSTANKKLYPIISVVQKYLEAGALYHLTALYNKGYHEYLHHKLYKSLNNEEKDFLKLHNNSESIALAAEYDNYPVCFYNQQEKEWQGISIDILNEITSLSGLSFMPVNNNTDEWPYLMEMLENGEADIVTELIWSKDRKKRFIWAEEPYTTDYYALLSKVEYEDININQVLYSKIGLTADAAYTEAFYDWFPNHPNTVIYPSTMETFDALKNGDVDLIMATRNLLLSVTNYTEQPGFKVNLVFNRLYGSSFGFNKNQKILCSIIGKAQKYVNTDAITDRWIRKVFDYRSKLSKIQNLYLAASSSLLLAVLILIFILFIKKRQINKDLEVIIRQHTEELVKQTTMLSTIYNSIPDLVFSKDTNSIYTSCNPSFEKFAGCKEAELIGKTDMEIFKINEDMAKLFIAADKKVLKNENVEVIEEFVTYPDGTKRLLETLKTPMYYDGNVIGMMGISRDITDRKAAEKAAHAASIAKSEFLARMSHEIRTPLNAIIGMAQIIKPVLQTPDKIQSSVNEIIKASSHLLGILNDVLDMSKIESGKFSLTNEAFDIKAAMEEVSNIILHRCNEKQISFAANISDIQDVCVMGDKLRLKQVFINLLGNAVKFTHKGGNIDFSVLKNSENNESITMTFTVRDNGIGMSDEQIANLFKAFEQADNSIAARFGGTGLGLAISQNLVEKMGGKILLNSSPGKGSVFYFTISMPKSLDNSCNMIEQSVVLPDLSGIHILLAEDIEINRMILNEMLADTNICIDEAMDGLEAVKLFEKSREGYYKLIFMDIQMPNMDGYEAAMYIRKLKRCDAEAIPIIAMTANAYKEDIEKAYNSGMNGHLAKPIDINSVKQILFKNLFG